MTQLLVLDAGGVAGLVLGGFVADRRGIKPTALCWFAASAVLPACPGVGMASDLLLDTVVFLTGVFVFSAQVLVYAYVTHFYPAALRGTALGSASGIGHPWGFPLLRRRGRLRRPGRPHPAGRHRGPQAGARGCAQAMRRATSSWSAGCRSRRRSRSQVSSADWSVGARRRSRASRRSSMGSSRVSTSPSV